MQFLSGISLVQGTLTADAQSLSSSVTWNNSGVTFTHWLLNITDTASATASLLINAQVGGSSKFKVSKSGVGTFSSDVVANSVSFSPLVAAFMYNNYC